MTTTLLLNILLATIADGEYLGRGLMQLTLTYLALRGGIPAELAALLQVLGAAIAAAGSSLLSLIDSSMPSGRATPCHIHQPCTSTLQQRCHLRSQCR
jgi:hypothetical protein